MPELIAKTALQGHAPLTLAATTLAEGGLLPLTSIAPYPNQKPAVDAALKPLGLSFPAPDTLSAKGAARIIWTGRDQAFLIGVPAPDGLSDAAALTDQTDGWATLTLTGPAATDALMRLVALDLRLAAFPVGKTARAGLNHMSLILSRTGPDAFELLVFRSMARSAWHEIAETLEKLAARQSLT